MSTPYTYQVLKVAVAQICQNIGWYSITASSLELLIDVLDKYMREMCKTTHNYTELYNRTEANLDDLGLTFRELGINLSELEEYIQYVDPVVPANDIPKYPVKKNSHLNFLKPGSKEVLTRPMHIHEHLPAIYPEDEEPSGSGVSNDKDIDVVGTNEDSSSNAVFKRPADASSDGNANKKQRVGFEEEGRPTREITSVMMTTSGFISPAREGKLPESKPPVLPPEFKPTPPPAPPPTFTKPPSQNQPMPINSIEKKFEKKIRKKEKEKEKKKEKPPKELKTPKPELGPVPPIQMSAQPPQMPLQQHQPTPQQSMMSSPSLPPQLPNHPPQFANIPGMPSISQIFPGMSQKKIMALAKKAAMGKKIPKKYKIKPNKMDLLPPMLKPEKKKPVGRPPKNPLAHAMSKYGSMGALQKPMLDTFGRDIQLPQQPGLLQPPPNFMPGQNFFSDSMKQPFPSQLQMMPSQAPIPPQSHPSLIEGKLVSEPDRNKLNIFKKISSSNKNKEDLTQKNFSDPALDFAGSARPELDIFRTGQNPGVPPNLDFMMTKIPKKHKTPKQHHQPMADPHAQLQQQHNELPLNMSMSKSSDFSVDDLSIPKTPNFPRTPDLKLEKKEKKKRKEKEKKSKEIDWPPKLNTFFNPNAPPSEAGPSNQNPFLQKTQDAASILQSAGITPAQQNLFLPFSNLFFPGAGGPGLIPNLSAFNPMSSGPFGLPGSSLGIPGSDLNLQKFQKPSKKQEKKDAFSKMQSLSKPDKTFCNVAPLVPPSIIESVKPRILDLPLGAEKLPSATQITPIKSFQPDKGFDIFKSTSITPSNLTSTPNIKTETFVNRQQETVMTYDLTSSPEPNVPAPKPKSPPPSLTITPAQPIQHQLTIPPPQQTELPPTTVSINPPLLPSATDESTFIPSIDNLPMCLNVMASPKIKEKSEKKKDKEHKKEKKDKEGKIKKKKDKKDKNKNKEGKEERKEKKEKRDKEGKEKSKKDKKEKRREKERASSVPDSQSQSASANDTDTADNVSTSSVPKLTLKLGNSPRPLTPDVYKKISKVKKDDYEFSSPSSSQTYGSLDANLMKEDNSEAGMMSREREASPELAKISALITRPPKQKPSKRKDDERSPKLSGAETNENPSKDGLKPAKQPKLMPGMGSGSATPSDGNVKTGSDILTSPSKHSKKKPGNMSDNVRDVDGNEVWICPACGQIDDGSPMIGCDSCSDWFHFVCVGIQVPPGANEDWYCRVCISKKQEGDEKKKKRKKKDKKEH